MEIKAKISDEKLADMVDIYFAGVKECLEELQAYRAESKKAKEENDGRASTNS